LKCVSSLQPLPKANFRDLSLLLGSFTQLGLCIIIETMLKNTQNLGRGFSRRAHNKDAMETPLIFSICIR
jgi:hypothetical protein